MLLRRIARPLLAAAFIGQGIDALRSPKPAADATRPTLEGLARLPDPVGSYVPRDAETFARVTAAVQIGGGLLLASGRVPRLASAALATTVIPANLGSHMFWSETDPERKAAKRREFLTDLSLLGGLIIAAADTAGKPSLGWRGRRAAQHFGKTVVNALPGSSDSVLDNDFGERVVDLGERVGHNLSEGLHVGAERGRELATVAAERGAPLLAAARERGTELAAVAAERSAPWLETARERAAELAETARDRGTELAETARERGTELAETARERGTELAETARDRGVELAETARDRGEDLASEARRRRRLRRAH